MIIDQKILDRSGNICELCNSIKDLDIYTVIPKDDKILICKTCKEQIKNNEKIDKKHWHCLNNSMWSEINAIKVVAYRMLSIMKNQDMIDMMYLEDDILEWAKAGLVEKQKEDVVVYKDFNGTILSHNDTVVIIKDLPVKGAGFIAKQGTLVKNISLVLNDNSLIEGKVNGIKIHLKTCFLKKS
jgi:protein PhnA